ncbi:transposase [Microvirga massiliensis]|uniref:transposase n=1 Tax=Microvirga massiliensis TaxID=1033741 RepID=UPI00164DF99F
MSEEIRFITKPKLGQAMLARAFAAGVPRAWVVGDSGYGADHQARRLIEAHGRSSVLAVTSAQRSDASRSRLGSRMGPPGAGRG